MPPSRQTLPFALAHLRSLRDADLGALDLEQLDLRRCAIHRHWSRFRDDEDFVRHPLLAIRGAKHLHGHALAATAAVHHAHIVDLVLYVLLHSSSLPRRVADNLW